MKMREKIMFVGLIFLLILLHRYMYSSKEGFSDDSSSYNALKKRLIDELGPYCKVSAFVQEQVKTISSSTNQDPTTQINQTYKGVYSCTDSLASSRPSCLRPNRSMEYVSCDTYMKLPNWSPDGRAVIELMKITNDLPERLIREAEWLSIIIQKLEDSIATANNPPSSPPTVEQINKFKEGFNGSCSSEAAKLKISDRIAREASSCYIPSVTSEIARINTLLNSKSLKDAISRMDGLMASMLKAKSNIDAIKSKFLDDGPKKTYDTFKGGDRTIAFLFSLRQNQ